MGAVKRRAADRAGRPPMRSPGRPSVGRREERQRFWRAIAAGRSSEEAAAAAGVSAPVGVRWFREGGGMPSVSLRPTSGSYLSFSERKEIALLRAGSAGVREIARRLGRSPSTISRELRRNAATRSGRLEYRATTAQWAGRPTRSSTEAGKARHQRRVAAVRAGAARGDGHHPERRQREWARGALDRPPPWSSQGSALGAVVEPRADRAPAPGRLSR
jgi:DNA-binding CsgD family transcriptional regulator